MHLSDHDLRQLDEAYLDGLTPAQARALLSRALADLKAARERLNQNPSNSSRPPSSRAPWETRATDEVPASVPQPPDEAAVSDRDATAPVPEVTAGETPTVPAKAPSVSDGETPPERRPGRRRGAPGHSRTQRLAVNAERTHAPTCCHGCGAPLSPASESHAHNARYAIDLIQPGGDATGLVLHQTKHTYLECRCVCGHWTQAEPGRADAEAEWTVALTEWHLAGPTLVTFICFLTQRMRLSRARVQEFLFDWLGLALSTATINQCVHEAGRAVAPVVEEQITATIRTIDLLHADETSWKQHGQLLWLWVFTCAQATLFVVGKRSVEVVREVLGTAFRGWLMSDGFWAYRELDQRLRCLAHLIRKAHGLEESLEREAQRFGAHLLAVLETVIAAVYAVRSGAPPPAEGLRAHHAALLKALLGACERHAASRHEKTRALARELLNDWDTFWVVLDHPDLPLTNNEAERALRHWVIARRIGMGTRTDEGTRALANLASVIETCRKRGISPWPYLAEVIGQRRQGLQAPPLPLPAGT